MSDGSKSNSIKNFIEELFFTKIFKCLSPARLLIFVFIYSTTVSAVRADNTADLYQFEAVPLSVLRTVGPKSLSADVIRSARSKISTAEKDPSVLYFGLSAPGSICDKSLKVYIMHFECGKNYAACITLSIECVGSKNSEIISEQIKKDTVISIPSFNFSPKINDDVCFLQVVRISNASRAHFIQVGPTGLITSNKDIEKKSCYDLNTF